MFLFVPFRRKDENLFLNYEFEPGKEGVEKINPSDLILLTMVGEILSCWFLEASTLRVNRKFEPQQCLVCFYVIKAGLKVCLKFKI